MSRQRPGGLSAGLLVFLLVSMALSSGCAIPPELAKLLGGLAGGAKAPGATPSAKSPGAPAGGTTTGGGTTGGDGPTSGGGTGDQSRTQPAVAAETPIPRPDPRKDPAADPIDPQVTKTNNQAGGEPLTKDPPSEATAYRTEPLASPSARK